MTLEEGRQAGLRTVSVETRHVLEFEEQELPAESSGQLHEGDSYMVRWTYTLAAQGGRPPFLSLFFTTTKSKNFDEILMFLCSAETPNSPEDDGRGADRSSAVFLWRGRRSGAALQSRSHEDSQVRLQTAADKNRDQNPKQITVKLFSILF